MLTSGAFSLDWPFPGNWGCVGVGQACRATCCLSSCWPPYQPVCHYPSPTVPIPAQVMSKQLG